MSNKITGSDLEKLIKEAMLSEREFKKKVYNPDTKRNNTLPLRISKVAHRRKPTPRSNEIEYDAGHVFVGKSEEDFPAFPKNSDRFLKDLTPPGDSGEKYRKGAKFLFGKDDPKANLTLSDIEKLFIDLSYDSGTKLKKPEKRWALRAAYIALRDLGADNEKTTWNNSLALLAFRNKEFKNYYVGNDGNIKREHKFQFFGTPPDPANATKNEKQAIYSNSWVTYKAYLDADDKTLSSDSFITDKDQKKRDFFNIDLRNHGSEVGSFPPEVNAAMRTLFPGPSSLRDRIKTITKFSQSIKKILNNPNEENDFANLGLQKMISSTIICDYLNSIIEDVDSGASAYLFEAFCAAIAGGNVEGKSKTDEGKMGAVDFTMSNGAAGSSKLYSRRGSIEQAVNGFKEDEIVHYITALKEKDEGQILRINLYTYKVAIEKLEETIEVNILSPAGDPLDRQLKKPGGKVDLSKARLYNVETLVGTFELLRTSSDELKSFREVINKAAKSFTNGLQDILPKISEIQSDSSDFGENLNVYAASGRAENGNKAIEKLAGLKDLTKQLFNLFHEKEGYEGVNTTALGESKLTPDALKKIIEESFKR